MNGTRSRRAPSSVGLLLQEWRRIRRKSQLDLALEADVTPRHLSFVETGRSRPSREMVLMLASALDVPLRERNALLLAAGFAPLYHETDLGAAELAPALAALKAMLGQQEPYPAVVMNRHWDVLLGNDGASRLFGLLLDGRDTSRPMNVVRLMFDPRGLRPFVANWEEAAEALVRRIHREAVCGVPDPATSQLVEEVFSYPGVPEQWRKPDVDVPLMPVVPVRFAKDSLALNFFSAVTTLGTPQDVTLQEIRVECFFPLDPATAELSRALAAGRGRTG